MTEVAIQLFLIFVGSVLLAVTIHDVSGWYQKRIKVMADINPVCIGGRHLGPLNHSAKTPRGRYTIGCDCCGAALSVEEVNQFMVSQEIVTSIINKAKRGAVAR